MNAKPLYQSYRASFDKDIHLPICGITAAPTVVWEILTADDLSVLSCPTPPQNVILHVTPELTVAGQPLYDVLSLCNRTVPILVIDSIATADALVDFCDYNHLADALLCATYDNRALLAAAYNKLPLLRGMLYCRGVTPDIDKLPALAVSHGAISVILDAAVATADAVHSLQQRFISIQDADCQQTFVHADLRGLCIRFNVSSIILFLTSVPDK